MILGVFDLAGLVFALAVVAVVLCAVYTGVALLRHLIEPEAAEHVRSMDKGFSAMFGCAIAGVAAQAYYHPWILLLLAPFLAGCLYIVRRSH